MRLKPVFTLFLAVACVLGASATAYANGENDRNGDLVRTQIPTNRSPIEPMPTNSVVPNYIYHEPGMPMLLNMDFSGPIETWGWAADELAALRTTDVFLHRVFLAGWLNSRIVPDSVFVTVYAYGRQFQGVLTRANETPVFDGAGNVIGWDNAPIQSVHVVTNQQSWGAHFNGVLTFTGNFAAEFEDDFLSATFFDLVDAGEIDPSDPQLLFLDFDITTLDGEELAELGFRREENFENLEISGEFGEAGEISETPENDTSSHIENVSFADFSEIPQMRTVVQMVDGRIYAGELPLVGLMQTAAFEWIATYKGDLLFTGIVEVFEIDEGLPDIVVSGLSPIYGNNDSEIFLPFGVDTLENTHHYRQFFGD
ncbi:MAG: hypothetical protein FWG65_03190 [Turicibacter sp.]|nr:hypothetical protein [Turicibacter sp.]